MATIAPTVIAAPGTASAVGTTTNYTVLTGTADTFVYNGSIPGSILVLNNPTAGALTPLITGSTAPTGKIFAGYAAASLAGGVTVGAIAAGASRVIYLDAIALWLAGTISITGGTGLSCALLTQG